MQIRSKSASFFCPDGTVKLLRKIGRMSSVLLKVGGLSMSDRYKGYRMPKSIIGYAVRHYYLSLRDISEMLLERGIEISYEIIRKWCRTWDPVFARSIRQKIGSSLSQNFYTPEPSFHP